MVPCLIFSWFFVEWFCDDLQSKPWRQFEDISLLARHYMTMIATQDSGSHLRRELNGGHWSGHDHFWVFGPCHWTFRVTEQWCHQTSLRSSSPPLSFWREGREQISHTPADSRLLGGQLDLELQPGTCGDISGACNHHLYDVPLKIIEITSRSLRSGMVPHMTSPQKLSGKIILKSNSNTHIGSIWVAWRYMEVI